MGFCCLPVGHPLYSGVNRRLDIKVYPQHMFPFALLYFTGSDHFNRSMRFYARKCGWTLSDHGLQPVNRVKGLGKVWIGDTVHCRTEKDVFEAMGLHYIPPTQRNVYQHFDLSVEEVKQMKQEEQQEEQEEQEKREKMTDAGLSTSGKMTAGTSSSDAAGSELWPATVKKEEDTPSGGEEGEAASPATAMRRLSQMEPEDMY
jgi:hypothetical protein